VTLVHVNALFFADVRSQHGYQHVLLLTEVTQDAVALTDSTLTTDKLHTLL